MKRMEKRDDKSGQDGGSRVHIHGATCDGAAGIEVDESEEEKEEKGR